MKNACWAKAICLPLDLLGLQGSDNLYEQHCHRWAQCTLSWQIYGLCSIGANVCKDNGINVQGCNKSLTLLKTAERRLLGWETFVVELSWDIGGVSVYYNIVQQLSTLDHFWQNSTALWSESYYYSFPSNACLPEMIHRGHCLLSHLVLVGGGTLYGGEGMIGPGLSHPPGPAPISARGPLAHTRGGPDQRAGAGPSNTRSPPSTLTNKN